MDGLLHLVQRGGDWAGWRIGIITIIITRHSLVRAKGEVFGLLYVCLLPAIRS